MTKHITWLMLGVSGLALATIALVLGTSSYLSTRVNMPGAVKAMVGGRIAIKDLNLEPGKHWFTYEARTSDGRSFTRSASFTVIESAVSLACLADLTGDGVVDGSDRNALLDQLEVTGEGLPGDIDGDGVVSLNDLQAVTDQVGKTCSTSQNCAADLNQDGVTNNADFTLFRSHYRTAGEDLPGDYDGDGDVDAIDFTEFFRHWKECAGNESLYCDADLNLDSKVDDADAEHFMAEFNGENDTLAGDFDADGDVDFADMFQFRLAWNQCTDRPLTIPDHEVTACDADYNGDGTVNILDVIAIRNVQGNDEVKADLNKDGVVDEADVALARSFTITPNCPLITES